MLSLLSQLNFAPIFEARRVNAVISWYSSSGINGIGTGPGTICFLRIIVRDGDGSNVTSIDFDPKGISIRSLSIGSCGFPALSCVSTAPSI